MKTEDLRIEVADIETYKALFLYCGYDPGTDKRFRFEISHRVNQADALVKHLLEYPRDYLVTYNGVGFDGQVLQFIILNNDDWFDKDVNYVLNEIFEFAQKTIDDRNYGLQPKYREQYMNFKQIDLMLLLHYDNDAKRTSLKWTEFSMDKDIEELPIDFRKETLSSDEIEEVISYCWNDIGATYSLYRFCVGDTTHPDYAGKNKIQLRLDLIAEYEFSDVAINWNDVKIGAELNKKVYMELAKLNNDQLYKKVKERKSKTGFLFKECFPDYMNFKTPEFKKFFSKVGATRVNLNVKQEFPFTYKGTTYMFAKGGGHSSDKPRFVKPTKNEILMDADVGSMYPNKIRKSNIYPAHLGPKWNEAYVLNIPKRLEAKKKYKETGDKKYDNFQECFKLVMNGNFGRLGDRFDWQYDPFAAMSVTIGSQIDIFMLAEAMEMNGHHVISMNTDGLTILTDRDRIQDYYRICKEWEETVGNDVMGNLEYVEYEWFAQTSVNDYITAKRADWKEVDGVFVGVPIDKPVSKRLKKKGDFLTSYELHKNKSKAIVPMALEKYFAEGIPVADTIRNHRNIFDFCIAKKASRDYFYRLVDRSTGKVNDLNKMVRYYCAKTNEIVDEQKEETVPGKLYKIKSPHSEKTGPVQSSCESTSNLQVLFNRPFTVEKWEDYNIDYDYYINQTYNILGKILPGTVKDIRQKDSGQISLF